MSPPYLKTIYDVYDKLEEMDKKLELLLKKMGGKK